MTVPVPTTYAAPSPSGPRTSISTGGTYLVGTDIAPGIYRTPGGSSCYWARLRSLDTSDIIDNHNSAGPQVVEILPTDRAFLTTCSTWTSDASVGTTPTTVITTAVGAPVQSSGQMGFGGLTCSYRVALTLRTAQSAVAVCDDGTGTYTYKGLRLKDSARIDIAGAVPTATGFTVTNAGTRYDVSRAGLVIDDGQAITEVAIAAGP